MSNLGFSHGDICKRNGCVGGINIYPSENCSCHISAPCGSCTSPRNYCDQCGWEEANDPVEPVIPMPVSTVKWELPKVRAIADLDNSKIDWVSKSHTHFSMIKEGVYPEGTTAAQVKKEVDGTFGGRFEYFYEGRFKYIAYTD